MAELTGSKDKPKDNTKYNLSEFFENYDKTFDLPPLRYERPEDMGWRMLANAIISNTTGIEKYVNYARKYKALMKYDLVRFVPRDFMKKK